MLSNKTRSLNFNQTLEELLGSDRSKAPLEQSSVLSSTGRPPTRHGRESLSSSEESREPTASFSSDRSKAGDFVPSEDQAPVEDEFLAKLNEIRRRSLVNMKDVRENQRVRQPSEIVEEAEDDANNNSSPDVRENQRVRQPSEIVEEAEDDANNNSSPTLKKLLSRPSTSESSHTFRVSVEPPPPSIKPIVIPTPAPRSVPASEEKSKEENTKRAPSEEMVTAQLGAKSQHDAWLRKKLQEERKRKRKEKEEAARKEEEEKERREQARKLFERWKKERDEKEREKRRKERAKEKEKQAAQEALAREKKIEAEKSFEAWKRSHSASRKPPVSEAEKEKERQKEEARKEAEKAFEAWKNNKTAAQLTEKRKAAAKIEAERKQLEEEKEYRQLLAQQTYETWLEIKDNERLLSQSMSSLGFEDPSPLPWLPPSNTCPRRFVPSRNRWNDDELLSDDVPLIEGLELNPPTLQA
ncbi:unnamed protein product [Nippostrongylus brasiliensis]|uniref:Coiled-coil domain-containing protein 181 n=1 Tax=Nippostrongylus brasiliensis TaxID=27835 RepID=A0A0N4YFK7_NIPBR|nr:unnamed protein product [Nippostrongylus brasiliensis]